MAFRMMKKTTQNVKKLLTIYAMRGIIISERNKRTNHLHEGGNKMYEVVRIVKGHEITRMVGTHGFYHVRLTANTEMCFRTIKAAAEFINQNF